VIAVGWAIAAAELLKPHWTAPKAPTEPFAAGRSRSNRYAFSFFKSLYMPHPVLNEDWSDYDNRKITGRQDSSKFVRAPHPRAQFVECVTGKL
jgi:hypothetical protein